MGQRRKVRIGLLRVATARQTQLAGLGNLRGIVMMATGVLLVCWGSTQSKLVVYRLLAARSRILRGEWVNRCFQVVGAILIVLGPLWAIAIIW